MKLNLLLTALLTSTLSTHVLAFSDDEMRNRPSGPPDFSQFDTNGDGVLTQDEVQGPMKNDFEQIDSNSDGEVSEQELDSFMKNHRPPQQ